MLKPLRSRVQTDNTVPTTCPACGAVRPIPSDAFETKNRCAEIQCPCGKTFTALAEFRKAHRRDVALHGTYTRLPLENETGQVRINNLSMTGVGFTLQGDHGLSGSDLLKLQMVFDKGDCSDVEFVAEVVHISNNGYAGCRFKEMSLQQEEALASYLVLIP